MRIGFNGLPFFTKELTENLTELRDGNKYIFYNTYEEFRAKLLLKLRASTLDGFVSFKGVSESSKSLDLVIEKKIPLLMYWHGTDVSMALKRAEKGDIEWRYIKYATHFTDAPWLKEELLTIGVDAQLLPFKGLNDVTPIIPDNYASIKVLSYVGKGREEFYGLSHIVQLAHLNPRFSFTIVGTTQLIENCPDNLEIKGWVEKEEMAALMKSHAILMRLTEHDGNAQMILEALSMGMECIWTNKSENCHFWDRDQDLNSLFHTVVETVEHRDSLPNIELANYYRENFQKQIIIQRFADTLKRHFDK